MQKISVSSGACGGGARRCWREERPVRGRALPAHRADGAAVHQVIDRGSERAGARCLPKARRLVPASQPADLGAGQGLAGSIELSTAPDHMKLSRRRREERGAAALPVAPDGERIAGPQRGGAWPWARRGRGHGGVDQHGVVRGRMRAAALRGRELRVGRAARGHEANGRTTVRSRLKIHARNYEQVFFFQM